MCTHGVCEIMTYSPWDVYKNVCIYGNVGNLALHQCLIKQRQKLHPMWDLSKDIGTRSILTKTSKKTKEMRDKGVCKKRPSGVYKNLEQVFKFKMIAKNLKG